jgi:N-carbamoylputrescine amidase
LSWVRDAASQGAEVITLRSYASHYFCQSEDVDNFAVPNHYTALPLSLLAL